MLIKKSWLGILTVFLFGCATHQRYEDSLAEWTGKRAPDLVRKWGTPSSIGSLADGGKVYLYLVRNKELLQIKKEPGSDQVIPLFDCKTTFLTDRNDTIVGYKFEGHACKEHKKK